MSEKEIGEKWDRCVTNALIKTATGLGVGVLFSFVLFKGKSWPVAFGLGTGIGMGVSNCQSEFRQIYPSRCPKRKCNAKPVPSVSEGS